MLTQKKHYSTNHHPRKNKMENNNITTPQGHVFNYLDISGGEPGLKIPCITLVTTPVSTVSTEIDHKLLNGCGSESYVVEVSNTELAEKMKTKPSLFFQYNYPDSTLYAVTRFVSLKILNEEEIQGLVDDTIAMWNNQDQGQPVLMKTEDSGDVRATIGTTNNKDFHVRQVQVEIPKDHYWLGSIFDTPEKMLMYEDFLECPIMFRRFVRMLKMKHIPIPEGATSSVMLPIHKKDKTTGEILISSVVLATFEQYQYCQNFLNTKQFPLDSAEHIVGKLMILYPKFCTYMMELAQMQNEGREIHNFEESYDKQVKKAMEYIQKDSELVDFYDNYWLNKQ